MRPLLLASLLVATPLPGLAQSAAAVEVRLTDGTVLKGRVVGADAGKVVVETDTLGLVEVPVAKLAGISPATTTTTTTTAAATRRRVRKTDSTDAASAPGTPTNARMAISALQSDIAADPAFFQAIMELAEDPRIVRLVTSPEVLSILASGDLEAADRSDKVRQLTAHPGFRALLERIKQRKAP